jgi:hypothetical protein
MDGGVIRSGGDAGAVGVRGWEVCVWECEH